MRRRTRSIVPSLAAATVLLLLGGATVLAAAPDALIAQGRRLYVEGIASSGQPLTGLRPGGGPLVGAAAACIACHRRSGLGGVEGEVQVPPISGRALYAGTALKDRVVVSLDPRRGRSWNQSHAPYTEESLLAALRDGVHVSGRALSPLMPRYALDGADFKALEAYLAQLSTAWSPGVSGEAVRLATVIAPGVAPERRAAFLETINAALDQKNSNTIPGRRHMINPAESILHVERRWELEIWELEGPPADWGAELAARYAKAPVFAIVSGLSDGSWEPVQAFCDREQVPCWFPSVPATPEETPAGSYGFYFSRGVALEAEVIASRLATLKPARVVQLLAPGTASAVGARALTLHLGARATVEVRSLGAESREALSAALADVSARDAVVLWLGPAGLHALAEVRPPPAPVFLSTRLATGLAPEIPAAWRASTHLAYPFELPPVRDYNTASFYSWLAVRNVTLVDPVMQSEAYFAMSYLQSTLSDMLDNVYRDYLIDRGESMLVRREVQRAEEETLMRQQGHPPARAVGAASRLAPGAIYGSNPQGPLAQGNTPAIGARQGTTIYPRMSLAPGQHYASKGAYLVHYTADGSALVAETDWLVPEG